MSVMTNVKRDHLQQAVQACMPAVGKSGLVESLTGFLLEATDDGLRVTAHNLELSVSMRVPAESTGDWTLAIPAKQLADFARSAPGEQLMLTVKDAEVSIVAGKARARLMGFPEKEWARPVPPEGPSQIVPADQLARALARTRYIAHGEQGRKIPAIQLRLRDGRMAVTACTNHRIARSVVPLSDPPESTALIMPALADALSVLEGLPVPCEVTFGAAALGVRTEGMKIQGQRADSVPFPDVDRVIPTDHAATAVVEPQALLAACRRAVIFATEETPVVVLQMKPGSFAVAAKASAESGYVEPVQAVLEGIDEPRDLHLNARYLTEMVSAYDDAGPLLIKMKGPLDPIIMRPSSQPDEIGFILPIRPPGA
jgi:DNA polymerase-3 subunit beta